MNEELAIEAHNLTKRFGAFTAVDAAEIGVKRGSIYGFLGPNGAGKSTAIRMLTGLMPPSSGSIRIESIDVRRHPEKAKRRIGYMTQHFSLYEDLTLAENMDFYGGVYGQKRGRREELLHLLGLEPYLAQLAGQVPGGIKQKLSLCCVLMHDPPVLFLDEPTAGVDPLSRRAFWDIINRLSHDETTVFLTTHFLDEAEYCNDLGFISAGKVVAGGSPRNLKMQFDAVKLFEIRTRDYTGAERSLGSCHVVRETYLHGPRIHAFAGSGGTAEIIEDHLRRAGHEPVTVRAIPPSMEDIFIMLTTGTPAVKVST